MWPNWKSLETQDNMKNNQWREKVKQKMHQTQHTENFPPSHPVSVECITSNKLGHKHEITLNRIACSLCGNPGSLLSLQGGGGGYWGWWCPLSSVICRFLPLLIFPRIERTQVIHLNDKAGRGIQFVSHCTALCLSRVYCGIEVTWGGDGGGLQKSRETSDFH